MQPEDQAWHDSNKAFWDQAAGGWRTLDEPSASEVQELLGQLECPAGSLVLDAGCGPGLWSLPLAEAGLRVRAVDLSPQMVQAARERAAAAEIPGDRLAFLRSTLAGLPFPGTSFDGILCRNVLDFVPNPGEALVELKRVLKPGRNLALTVLGGYSPAKRRLWRRFLPNSTFPNIANYILPWEAEDLMAELGWDIVQQVPGFGAAASGTDNPYTADFAAQLGDRVLQQTVASWWTFVARKPVMNEPTD
jgi:SAM-dependent methyltransferase